MKYYLIKCEKGLQDNLSFLYNALGVEDNTEKVIGRVELTEEELKFLQEESLNYDSDFILAKKLRGVLE